MNRAGLKMTKIEKKSKGHTERPPANPLNCPTYALALARGGSYLLSTVTPEGRAKQLMETVQDFVNQFGNRDLPCFLGDLENWLAVRNNSDGVAAVSYYKEHGTPPPVPVAVTKDSRSRGRSASAGFGKAGAEPQQGPVVEAA
jgi:hypothetical protein